ncbi:MAG TPA: tetratricopeptide repeat protein, partial [Fibrobacteraceae bacterium]|nr:tetratricopeptide repeat protein [Fibrobacteraceae bacterium]
MFHKSSLLFLIICVCGIGSSASFADDFFSKANALYDNGQYKEAVPFYRAAIDEGRYEPFAWFNLGNTLVQLQKNEVALVAYRRTVELLPDFVKAWVLLGDLYFLG